jgi:hypothetical protein
MRATIEHVYADDIRWTDDDGVTTAFQVVKPGSSTPEGSGFDVAVVRDGFIVELYTVPTDQGRESAGMPRTARAALD